MTEERSVSSSRTPVEVRVRPAYPRDLLHLVEFNRAMALETEGLELEPALLEAGVRAALDDPQKGAYFVAEAASPSAPSGARIVGALMLTSEWSDWRNGVFWWIQSVYVLPDMRGNGIFKKLYADVHERARTSRGVCGLRLYVEAKNERAQKTYTAVGMRPSHYRLFEVDFVHGEEGSSS